MQLIMTEDVYYVSDKSQEFYKESLAYSVSFQFDKMADDSWRRVSSDRPLSWMLEHLHLITTHFLIVRKHSLEEQNERWGNDRHIEVNCELRDEPTNATYIFSAELEVRYLEYLLEKYGLNPGFLPES
jgi:hypothetical protein